MNETLLINIIRNILSNPKFIASNLFIFATAPLINNFLKNVLIMLPKLFLVLHTFKNVSTPNEPYLLKPYEIYHSLDESNHVSLQYLDKRFPIFIINAIVIGYYFYIKNDSTYRNIDIFLIYQFFGAIVAASASINGSPAPLINIVTYIHNILEFIISCYLLNWDLSSAIPVISLINVFLIINFAPIMQTMFIDILAIGADALQFYAILKSAIDGDLTNKLDTVGSPILIVLASFFHGTAAVYELLFAFNKLKTNNNLHSYLAISSIIYTIVVLQEIKK